MRATRNIFFMFAAIAFCIRTSHAQYTATAVYVDADIINATSLVDPLSEKIKDVSATNFSLVINNPNAEDIWVNMQFKAHVTLDEDGLKQSLFLEGSDPYTSKPFLVPRGGRVFRSADASSKEFDFVYSVDKHEKQILKDKVTAASSGGRVPSGKYEVDIAMQVVKIGQTTQQHPIDVTISPSSHIEVVVTNPTNATLLQPSENGFEYPTPFPQFQWTTDVRKIELKVFEKRPEHESLEDAVSASDPFLDIVFEKDKQSGYLPSNFTYPQVPINDPPRTTTKAGPRPLERGKSYVVELDGLRTAFGYDIDPLRTLCLFRVSDPQGQMVWNILQTALSGGAYQNFLNIIQDQKLQVNSSRLTLNGVTISAQELQVILNQNKDKLKAIRFED